MSGPWTHRICLGVRVAWHTWRQRTSSRPCRSWPLVKTSPTSHSPHVSCAPWSSRYITPSTLCNVLHRWGHAALVGDERWWAAATAETASTSNNSSNRWAPKPPSTWALDFCAVCLPLATTCALPLEFCRLLSSITGRVPPAVRGAAAATVVAYL